MMFLKTLQVSSVKIFNFQTSVQIIVLTAAQTQGYKEQTKFLSGLQMKQSWMHDELWSYVFV